MARIRWLTLLLSCGPWALLALPSARAQSPGQLTLQIVPTSYASPVAPVATIGFRKPSHFHVLLTNTSTGPVALFEEWNSWGYYGLSFVVAYPDGRTVHAVKKPRGWDKNFPSTVTIAPGGFYVFDVDFDPTLWEHSPRLEPPTADYSLPCRLQAVYTIAPDKPSGLVRTFPSNDVPVWVGTLTSAEISVTLWP